MVTLIFLFLSVFSSSSFSEELTDSARPRFVTGSSGSRCTQELAEIRSHCEGKVETFMAKHFGKSSVHLADNLCGAVTSPVGNPEGELRRSLKKLKKTSRHRESERCMSICLRIMVKRSDRRLVCETRCNPSEPVPREDEPTAQDLPFYPETGMLAPSNSSIWR